MTTPRVNAQNCSVNANVNQTICVNEPLMLIGSAAGLFSGAGTTTWSQVGGPSAIIASPNSLITQVTGIIGGYNYTFRLSTTCLDGSLVYDDVRYTVLPVTIATAGPDQMSCPASPAGNLAGNNPGALSTGLWIIVGANNGVTIVDPTSPTSAFNLVTGQGTTTLRWTITHSNGCDSFDEMVITNLGGDSPVNAGPDQVLGNCYSTTQSTTLTGSFGGNGTGGQDGSWSVVSGPGIPTIANPDNRITVVSGLTEGVYVFRWTVSGPCINGSDDVQITVPAPTADVSTALIPGGNQIWCDGRNSTVLTGSSASYANETVLWQQTAGPAGATIVSPNNPVTNVTGLDGTSTYTFRYTIINNLTACSSSATTTVSFAVAPFINIVPTQLFPSCGSSTASIPYTAGGSGVTLWSIQSGPADNPNYPTYPTGYFDATGSPLLIEGLSIPGTYEISVRRYSTIGISCETTFDNITVIISQPPSQSNAGTRQVLACNVFQTALTGNVPYVGTGRWTQINGPSIATIVDPNLNTTEITNLINGLYRFRWTISGGPACAVSQNNVTVLVASNIPTQAIAGPDQNVCVGTPVFMAGNYPVLNEWGEWSVLPATPGITFSNINSPVSAVTGLQANTIYTFTWTIFSACGSTTDDCIVNTSTTIGPIASDAGDDQCHDTGTTTVTLNGNDPIPGTGFWNQLTGPVSTITDPTLYNSTVTGMVDGNYTFEWVINSGGCLPTRDTVWVTISAPATVADAGADVEVCGNSTTLTGNTPVIGTGEWSQASGSGGAIIVSPNSPTTSITGLTDGVYMFYWTISNNACPVSIDSVNVFVSSPGSVAAAGPDQGLCAQTTVTMAATPPANGTGIWSIVSGPNTPNIVNPTSPTTVINNLVTGNYTFRWTVSGGAFCPSTSDDMNVQVTLAANAGPDQSYCEATTLVNLSGTVSTAGTWTQDSGPNTATITTTSANTATASGLIVGSYVFRYTVSAVGCSTTDVMTVTLNPPPTTSDAGPDQDLCDASAFALNGNVPVSGTGTWTKLAGPGSGSFIPNANTANATYTGAVPGIYVFVWTIANGTCSSGDQVRIVNSALPTTADAGPDQTQVCSDQATMAANLPVIGVGNWTQISGPNTPNIQSVILPNTIITGMIPGTYTFRWTITNGVICAPSFDDVEITALLTPTPAAAGPDQLLCNQASTNMAATPVVVGTGLWTQISGPNAANFFDPTSESTLVDNLINGTYIFEWTTTEGVCTSSDQVTIQNDGLPTVANAGTDQDICQFVPLTLNGNTPIVGTGQWSQTAGPISVVFLTPNSPTTSVIGALSGSYTFEWTISNGSCPSSTDAVDVVINDIPDQALAGPDQSICNTDNTFLNGNSPVIGVGAWSQVSGPNAATIVDPADRLTQVTNLITGTYEFKWEVANGSCTSSDNMLVVRHSDISVTGPVDATICDGGTQVLSVSATGGIGGYTYQWESSIDGNIPWNTISGATSASYTTPALAADQYYRCLVTASCGSAYSSTAHVTVVPDPAITVQPVGLTICSGTNTTLSVTATGGTPSLTYLWQTFSGSWVTASGTATNSTYITPNLSQSTQFRVLVSASGNGCNTITSDAVTVSVPRITTQPVSSTICTGGSVNALSVVVEAGSATLGYQWQSAALLAGPYANVTGGSGETTATYITDVLTTTTYFRCVVTVSSPACADLISNTATITVVPDPTIDTHPANATICTGGTNVLTVAASGGTPALIYQWQSSTTGGAPWTNVGTNSATYTTPALVITTYYQVVVSANGVDCNTITSNVATITIVPDPTISVQPVGATICNGGTHTMSVTATGNVPPGTLIYQWQISTNGTSGWTNVGANSNTYTTAALAATRYYRVVVTQAASGCSTTSANAQVTVVPDPNITTQPVGASICFGGNHTMSVVAAGGTPVLQYQWQISTTGVGGPWSDLSGENGTSYTTPATFATTWFRVVVSATGVDCNTVNSNVAAVVVEGDPIIDTQPIGAEICSGGTHSMTIAASGGTPSLNYQWESSTTSSTGPWTPVSGATNTSYTTPALLVTTWYHVVVTAPGSDCNTTVSNAVEVTVVPDPSITVQPSNITICSGTATTLSVTATGGTPSLNYLWESSPNGTTGWTTVGGNSTSYTTANLTIPTYFRVSVSSTGNGCNTVTSNVVTVDIPRILTQPVGATICSGGTHNMSVSVAGGSATLGYQWQFSDFDCNSGWSNIGGATTNSYNATILPLSGTRYYRCVISVTAPNCADLITNCTPVVVVPDPGITTQPVGATICQGSSHSMTVLATGGTPSLTYQWQSAVALAGPYANVVGGSGATTPTYITPAIASTTYYQVVVSASGNGCGSVISTPVAVFVNVSATANSGGNAAICSSDTYTLSGATATNYTSLLWTTSGTGTFNNPTIVNPIYSPSIADINAGSVTLTLTAYASAPCVNAVSTMTLTIAKQATANAGIVATVCQGTAYTVSGATAANYTSLLWTAPGPGVLTNATTLSPTYTPTAGQTGTVTLTLTANPLGTCTAATDQMLLNLNAAPTTANAGIDQSFCKSTTSTNMTANTPTSGTGLWAQLSGPNTALIASYNNPGTLISNLIVGTYNFQWTISNGVCTPSSDIVQIIVLNCGPIAVDDSYTTPEDTPLSGNLLTNDSDPDGDPLALTQFIVGGTAYPAGSTANIPGVGVIVVYSNGLFNFTPELNYTGAVPTIPYTISDGTLTATANLDITVTPVNDPPVAVDDIVTTPEDTPVSGNVLNNDSDPDGGPVTVTQFLVFGDATVYGPGDLATITGVGTLMINGDGTFTFTPDPGYNGPVPIVTYTIIDSDLAT
ncbi:MAG: hypothetical protein CVU14_04110, partial [Bacteroidetes bacterium HGW-Bacteroidetes-9]